VLSGPPGPKRALDDEPADLSVLDKELVDGEPLQKMPSWIPRLDYQKPWIPMFGPVPSRWTVSKGTTPTREYHITLPFNDFNGSHSTRALKKIADSISLQSGVQIRRTPSF